MSLSSCGTRYKRLVAKLAVRASRYAFQVGLAEDQELNALTGGLASQTFSLRNAEETEVGDREACFVCWCLNWMVQRNHCKLTLEGQNIPPWAGVRAVFWITLVLFGPFFLLFYFL